VIANYYAIIIIYLGIPKNYNSSITLSLLLSSMIGRDSRPPGEGKQGGRNGLWFVGNGFNGRWLCGKEKLPDLANICVNLAD
jgi:hypothetical protein